MSDATHKYDREIQQLSRKAAIARDIHGINSYQYRDKKAAIRLARLNKRQAQIEEYISMGREVLA